MLALARAKSNVSAPKSSLAKSQNVNRISKRTFVVKDLLSQTTSGSPLPHKTWLDAPNVPEHVANLPTTKISELTNKLKVASEDLGGETATVGVFLDCGSVYETESENGVAHFLEHMAFKGTHNRTKKALEEEIENMGATLNAYTSRESTVFYAKVFKKDIAKATEILSDILTNSVMSEADIERERSTILREMEEVNKDPTEVIFDHLHAAAFQGTSLGRTILGPERNVRSISRKDLMSYTKKYYTGPRMVVAAAGAVDHDSFAKLADKHFGHFPGYADGKFPDMPEVIAPNPVTPYTGSMVTIENEDMKDVHFAVAVQGVSWTSPDYFPMLLVQTILGNWDKTVGAGKNLSSPLAEIVTRENLGSSFNTFNTCYYNTGLFGVYGISNEQMAHDMVYEICYSWNRLAKNLTEGQLQRAKEKLKAHMLMQLDGTTSICEEIGRQVLTYKRRISANEIFGRINKITLNDIRRVVSEKCEDTDPAVVAVGALEQFPDYNSIRNYTYWNRW